MASKSTLIFTAILAVLSSATQAQVFNVPCDFQEIGLMLTYTCVIENVTIPDNEDLEIVFGGQHLQGRDDSQVERVHIWFSSIPFVLSQVFTAFPNLEVLNQGTNLTRIQPNAFANASSLLEFYTYSGPQLTTIEANAFAGAPRLNFLQIRDCGIQTIDENAFSGLSQLVDLFLQNLEIRELPVDVFRPLESVEVIYLNNNLLESLQGRLFEANPHLFGINLSYNRINAIERNFIDNKQALERLEFRENLCADDVWDTWSEGVTLDTMRDGLRTCFDNFEGDVPKIFSMQLRGSMTIRDQNGAEIITL